jgi:type II secretory ATPase GspE/PulE/Tfp pilus assembly ATPase PilB-like protein
MEMNEAIRSLIIAKASSSSLAAAAAKTGFKTLRQAGLQKAFEGITTVEEVLRVTQDQEVEGI